MVTPDKTGEIWHRGTKLGLIYAVITFLVLGLTTTQDPAGTLAWLQRFSFLVVIAPSQRRLKHMFSVCVTRTKPITMPSTGKCGAANQSLHFVKTCLSPQDIAVVDNYNRYFSLNATLPFPCEEERCLSAMFACWQRSHAT